MAILLYLSKATLLYMSEKSSITGRLGGKCPAMQNRVSLSGDGWVYIYIIARVHTGRTPMSFLQWRSGQEPGDTLAYIMYSVIVILGESDLDRSPEVVSAAFSL